MGRVFCIQPAPQALEGLDAWGALDSLPWPLDDAAWTESGLYGLEAGAEAAASGSCAMGATRSLKAEARGMSGGSAVLLCGLVKVGGGSAQGFASASLRLGFKGWEWTAAGAGWGEGSVPGVGSGGNGGSPGGGGGSGGGGVPSGSAPWELCGGSASEGGAGGSGGEGIAASAVWNGLSGEACDAGWQDVRLP